ncbi:MAG: ATP-binding protein [Methanospirillum sp.]
MHLSSEGRCASAEPPRPAILVVEDSPTQAAFLSQHLGGNGYQVRTARNGAEALAALEAWRPALVISDILMPEMNGYELCSSLKSDPRFADLPVILLTTLSDPADLLRGLACGADSFITKTFDVEVLLRRIRTLLDRGGAGSETDAEPIEVAIGSREYAIRAGRRQILEFFCSAYEVAIQKQAELIDAEARVRQHGDALARSNEELQRFAYVASHDLQEPLRSIVSFSQLLERRYKGKLDSDADEYIRFIVEGGTRMQMLITDLLQLSRVETRGRPFERVEAGELLADVLRNIGHGIEETGGRIEAGSLPSVFGDPVQLEQVFANLIGNAIKYRRDGVPPVIRISAEREGRFWRFAVADNGIGIEAEYFDRIFEMFQRLHTHDEFSGTGIGLAVVKKIVERHGGRVWVESTPGGGSTFFFTLPAA